MAAVSRASAVGDGRHVKFSNDRHARKILAALNENRKCTHLCDGVVVIGDARIFVQKNVLAAASHYFRLLFNYEEPGSPIVQSSSVSTQLDLTHLSISSDTFETILDYIYTSDITLSDDNIQDILQAADILLLTDLKNMCCEYLEQCVTPHNCLGILEFASRFTCPWVQLKMSQYLDKYFREISYSEEFLRLPDTSLKEILSRDTLSVQQEEEILDSIIRWYRFDVVKRQSQLEEVVAHCLRPSHISSAYLDRLEAGDASTNKLKGVIHFVKESRKTITESRCRGTTNVIFICGGEGRISSTADDVEVKSITKCVVPKKQKMQSMGEVSRCHWIDLAPMAKARIGHGLVEVGGYVYAIGGRDQDCTILNSGEKYDPSANNWVPIASMEHARVGFCLVAVDDNIYAIGGSNDMTEPLTSVECFNIFTNKWRPLPDMNLKRSWSTAAAVNKKIYVIAGGAIGKLFEAVECFDTGTETWYSVSPMRERRCDARAVAVDDSIYVFGGIRRIECPSAMHGGHSVKFCGTEIYSTSNDYWVQMQGRGTNQMCNMAESSQIYGALYDGEDIFVIGDLDVGGTFHCIRAFDRRTNMWNCVVPNHPKLHRNFMSCIERIPTYVLRELQWTQEKLTLVDIRKPSQV
ncbi:hypothetical protein ACJMK2_010590 [Sinanodonta woodiana]|uniref:BTB domain-containing protein n=1 Tax=Sinanodonta woodiana TaxID=1069815 RepID=A0ABD3VIT2_SINWO